MTVVAPYAHVWWTGRTDWERAQLPAVLGRIGGQYSRNPFRLNLSDYDAMVEVERPSRPHEGSLQTLDDIGRNVLPEEVYASARRRIGTTLRELRSAVTSLAGFRGHKSLVLYSEGFILAPRFPEFDAIIELARRANVAVHFLDPRGRESGCAQAEDKGGVCISPATERLKATAGTISIAEATGGRDTQLNDPVAEVQRILEESQAYYLIGYAPLEGGPGGRKVRVRVLREGMKVLARTRYVVLRPEQLKPQTPPEVEPLRSVTDATDLPIRAEVGLPTPDESAMHPASAKAKQPGAPVTIAIEIGG